jgi:predicted nucleic acid-binding protein
VSYLLDTNVISELRKGARANRNVRRWFQGVRDDEIFLSVLVLGEIRRGIESIRRRDPPTATRLESWLARITTEHGNRVLPVTAAIAEVWGRFNVPDPLPVIDSLLAATAHEHGLTVVTRNTRDVERTGVPVLDPFAPSRSG